MGLFRRGGIARKAVQEVNLLPPQKALCLVCAESQTFTRCWHRLTMMRQCPCCNTIFEDPAALYKEIPPQCRHCEEPLEQPEFDYGLCDACGSKFEIMSGAKPGLLPNRQQRAEMAKYGKVYKHKP